MIFIKNCSLWIFEERIDIYGSLWVFSPFMGKDRTALGDLFDGFLFNLLDKLKLDKFELILEEIVTSHLVVKVQKLSKWKEIINNNNYC